MTNPRRMRRHARRMRRYGLQPMVVINSGDPLPDLLIVIVARWLWRYRSELAPITLAATAMVAAWILHRTHPHWWPVLAMATLAVTIGAALAGSRLGLATRAERGYAMTVTTVTGGWLTAATAIGPGRPPLPLILTAATCRAWRSMVGTSKAPCQGPCRAAPRRLA